MATIPTVRGPVASDALGVTLMHEHLCFRAEPNHQPQAMDYAVKLTRHAAEVGINTMVDLGPYPTAHLDRIVQLNKAVPEMNLVLSTGAYIEQSTPEDIRALDEDGMAEHMTKDLTVGYDGYEDSGIKAGIIKVAGCDAELTEWEKKNFRAAARVHRELKVPIATHACAGARTQMETLRDAGADISATLYSHVEAEFGWEGRTREQEALYLEEVTKAGGYLLFNNFDFEFDTPFDDLLWLINWFEDRGYGEKISVSVDCNWAFDEDGRIWHEAEKEHPETGKRTYAYVITHAVPMLLTAGVSLQRIWKYLVENPRRYWEALGG